MENKHTSILHYFIDEGGDGTSFHEKEGHL